MVSMVGTPISLDNTPISQEKAEDGQNTILGKEDDEGGRFSIWVYFNWSKQ